MKIRIRLASYDWVVINSSAGKDSQVTIDEMVAECRRQAFPLDRVVVVHADLGRVEWKGTKELAQQQAEFYGLRFVVVKRPQGDLLDHVRARAKKLREQGRLAPAWFSPAARYCTSHHKADQVSKFIRSLDVVEPEASTPAWPSNSSRYCTSDHKRGQVSKVLVDLARKAGKKKGQRVRILNCMGLRAAESSARSKLIPFRLDKRQTNTKKVVHTFLPIHDLTEAQVWERIEKSGCPHHFAYDLGMPRLSCCFCIFAPRNALHLAGIHNTELLREYVKVEQEVGSKFRKELSLAEVLADVESGKQPGPIKTWEM